MDTASLKQKYNLAARQAFFDGIDAGHEKELIGWIRNKCTYAEKQEFYIVLGVGSELADMQARAQGYESEVHRAFEVAKRDCQIKEDKQGKSNASLAGW